MFTYAEDSLSPHTLDFLFRLELLVFHALLQVLICFSQLLDFVLELVLCLESLAAELTKVITCNSQFSRFRAPSSPGH
jgi:hypothetical protein